ncbi:hypothetical protein ABH925_000358 [Streptacidiphilus sp. EB129]|jgi:hypothetical protein
MLTFGKGPMSNVFERRALCYHFGQGKEGSYDKESPF